MSISPLELYRKRHCGPNRQSSRAQGGTQLLSQTKRLHLPISLDNSVEIGRTPNCGVALTEMHFGEFQNYRGAWCMKGTQYLCLRMLRHVETLCLQCSWLNFRQAAGQLKPLANGWQTAGKLISFIWIFTMSVAHIKYQNVPDAQISKCVLVHYAALFCSWVQVCPCLSKCDSV